MEYNAKEIILHIREQSVPTIIIVYDAACEHPFVFGTFLILILIYIYLPSLFYLIASSSPAFICAILLLGVILTYSETNISEEEEQKQEAYSENSYNIDQNDQELSYEYETSTDEEELEAINEEEEEEEEVEEEEEEDDEGNEEKDEGIGAVVNWTEDDQKNLLYLGTSEMERNLRLENLIAKRKAKKFLSFHYTEKNLIDLDVADNNQMMPTASALRRNLSDIRFEDDTVPCPSTSVIKPKPKRMVSFNLPDEKEKAEATCKEKDLTWVAPSNLAFVDEVEARSKEIHEISERDVISLDDLSPPVYNMSVSSEEDEKVENVSVQNVQNPKPSTPRNVPNLFTRSRVIKSSEDFPAILEENNMEMLIMEDDDFKAVDSRENKCEVDDDEVKEEDEKKSEYEAKNDEVKEEEDEKKSEYEAKNGVKEEGVDKEEKKDECEGKDGEVNVENREKKREGEATKTVEKNSTGIMSTLRMGKIKNITKMKFSTKPKSRHTEQ